MQSFNFDSGISVLVSDISMKEDFEIKRNQHPASQYFVLLFNELVEKSSIEHNERLAFDKFDLRKKLYGYPVHVFLHKAYCLRISEYAACLSFSINHHY